MSAAFKNSKRKLSQNELRRFMSEHKEKVQKITKKIESPLAKYNDLGQLTCILCQSIVKSEGIWTVHVNSKQHRENIEKAKKLKEKTNNFTTPLKRATSPINSEVPQKKLKSILKNSKTQKDDADIKDDPLPNDFIDTKLPITTESLSEKLNGNPKTSSTIVENVKPLDNPEAPLPEGFFDDPKKDAKARHVEFKDPIEKVWEEFQREIRDADTESAAIIAEDQDEATNERQIDEIEEQMRNWSRVLTLDKKKTEVISHVNKDIPENSMEEGTDEEVDIDEIFDWRSKKSF